MTGGRLPEQALAVFEMGLLEQRQDFKTEQACQRKFEQVCQRWRNLTIMIHPWIEQHSHSCELIITRHAQPCAGMKYGDCTLWMLAQEAIILKIHTTLFPDELK